MYAKKGLTSQPPDVELNAQSNDDCTSQIEKYLQFFLSESVQHRHWALIEIRKLLIPTLRNPAWTGSALDDFLEPENARENLFLIRRLLSDTNSTVAFEALHLLAEIANSTSQVTWILVREGLPDSHFHAKRETPSTLSNCSSSNAFTCWASQAREYSDRIQDSLPLANEAEFLKQIEEMLKCHMHTTGSGEHHSAIVLLTSIACTCAELSLEIWQSVSTQWLKEWLTHSATQECALRFLFILCKQSPQTREGILRTLVDIQFKLTAYDAPCTYILLAITAVTKQSHDSLTECLSEALPSSAQRKLACSSDSGLFLSLRCQNFSQAALSEMMVDQEKPLPLFLETMLSILNYSKISMQEFIARHVEHIHYFMSDDGLGHLRGYLRLANAAIDSKSEGNCAPLRQEAMLYLGGPPYLAWWPRYAPEKSWRNAELPCMLFCHLLRNVEISPSPDVEWLLSTADLLLRMALSEVFHQSSSASINESARLPDTLPHLAVVFSGSRKAKLFHQALYYDVKMLHYAAVWILQSALAGHDTAQMTTRNDSSLSVHPLIQEIAPPIVSLFTLLWFPLCDAPPDALKMRMSLIFPHSSYPHLHAFLSNDSDGYRQSLDAYSIFDKKTPAHVIEEWITWYFEMKSSLGNAPPLLRIIDGHSVTFRLFSGILYFSKNTDSIPQGIYRYLKQLCHEVFIIAEGKLHSLDTPIDVTSELIACVAKIEVTNSLTEYLLGVLVTVMPYFQEELLCQILRVWIESNAVSFVPLSLVGDEMDSENDTRIVISRVQDASEGTVFTQDTLACVEEILSLLPKGALRNGLLGFTLQTLLQKQKETLTPP
ncbi:Dynein heavy chain protein [Perkinsela sp. CCAP 1560/4]|nr:Dynein heavy chain protein [Perkinsela sp. CCAP 1560/4]|eukprot:KNH08243.1 Dynein heavy chain protein [Perkinsela sp. CCAP 1560/4]